MSKTLQEFAEKFTKSVQASCGKRGGGKKRTAKGNVTAKTREEFGDKEGGYPIFDEKSARSAVSKRGFRKGKERASVLNRAAAWAKKHKKEALLKWIQDRRKEDKEAGLI